MQKNSPHKQTNKQTNKNQSAHAWPLSTPLAGSPVPKSIVVRVAGLRGQQCDLEINFSAH
jgi:hypothetical protein